MSVSTHFAGFDLAAEWRKLVDQGAVVATVGSSGVTYGVRLSANGDFEEFVSGDADLNATLSKGNGQRFVFDGSLVASLHLVRSLKPPPTPGLTEMPPYDASKDSFVTGPFRLQIRPRVATISVAVSARLWDCFHNISPCDIRGHFLLIPTIDDKSNWRRQALTREDCVDLVWMARTTMKTPTCPPPWLLTFNSIHAGASQNHIHCHIWPNPSMPLLASDRPYAAVEATARRDVAPITLSSGVELALLEYPCAAVRICGGDAAAAGAALASVVEAVEALGCPYNVAVLGDMAWVFARLSPDDKALGLGASEMMGNFQCSTVNQFDMAAAPGFMAQALRDVSADAIHVWEAILEKCKSNAE